VVIGGGSDVNLSASAGVANLTLSGNATLTVLQTGSRVLRTSGIAIAPGSKLDMKDNNLIIDYTGTSPASSIRDLLITGRNGGAWNGLGLTSSTAATTPNRALGIAEAADIGTPASFAGQPIDSTTILVRYTVSGDADLDRDVDVADLGALASNWQQSNRRWSQGDFDYSATGLVDVNDLGILASQWQQILAPPSAPSARPALAHEIDRIVADDESVIG
jgi:hypothetical protein